MSRAEARINLAAIERNVAMLVSVAGRARLCAVVKADGYGHGLLPSANAALAGGASVLAVATATEADALRSALAGGAHAEVEILVLGALTEQEVPLAVAARATVTAWTPAFVRQLAKAAGRADHPLDVHVKLDTGLGRLGTRDPAEATAVSEMVASEPMLNLAGAWTHFATADQRGDEFFAEQLARFRAWIEPLRATHPNIVVHAANSAATLRDPAAHFDMVRCGVAIYGLDPFGENPASHGLLPALELHAAVAAVKSCATGESVGYGRRFVAEESTTIATIPVGYGDGYRRALSDRAEVLIGGHRYPVRGTISMDNTTVELGPASGISPGDEVTLLGRSGEEIITAEELASRSDTINYEITCAVTTRPSRLWHRDGVAVES